MKLIQLDGCILYERTVDEYYDIIYCEAYNELARSKDIYKLYMANIPTENNLQYKLLKKSPQLIFVNGEIYSVSLYNLFKSRDTIWIFEITFLYKLVIEHKYEIIKSIKRMYRRICKTNGKFKIWSFKQIDEVVLEKSFRYFINEKE
jgi:hypothetical protein